MDVYISNRQEDLPLCRERIETLVKEVISSEGRHTDEVSVHFVSKEEISSLHDEFFDDPTPTDCISFPLDQDLDTPHHVLGEVIVCPKVACEYVDSEGGDPYEEASLYLIHGLLHLMGYRDKSEAEIEEMRKAEKRHMEYIRAHGYLLHAP